MRPLECPKPEHLLEFVSIPSEVSLVSKFHTHVHLRFCRSCSTQAQSIRTQWERVLVPEPDITSSLLRVYSRLQKDETLILKGWKIGEQRRTGLETHASVISGWAFRSGVFAALLAVVGFYIFKSLPLKQTVEMASSTARLPFAQIRTEAPSRVQVRYVQPELLHSVEFETNGR